MSILEASILPTGTYFRYLWMTFWSQGAPPQFLTQPADVSLVENQLAHFECRLSPVGDPTMRVEWYHNGRPLSAGSRVRTINDFG